MLATDLKDALAMDVDSDCQEVAEKPALAQTQLVASKRRPREVRAADLQQQCWLCGEPGATKLWRKLECHDRCVNALNCHQRFLSDLAARVADDEARERDPAGYKQLVLPLVPVQENK